MIQRGLLILLLASCGDRGPDWMHEQVATFAGTADRTHFTVAVRQDRARSTPRPRIAARASGRYRAVVPDWSMGFTDVRGSAHEPIGFRHIGDLADLTGDISAIETVIRNFRDGRWTHRAA